MSTQSITERTATKQGRTFTADLVELAFLTPVAAAIYRYRTRNATADFDQELSAAEKTAFIREAAVIARRQDPRATRPAIYFAADCVTPKGLGSLRQPRRAEVVACLEVAVRAYDQALCDQAPPAALEQMRQLAEADGNAPLAPLSTTGVN